VVTLSARPLSGLPEVRAGDDLAALIAAVLAADGPSGQLRDGEVVAIAHKAVSKAEGAVVALAEVRPSAQARELASQTSAALTATAGSSPSAGRTVDGPGKDPRAVQVVLPADPDASARRLRARLRELTGARVGVLVTDSFGRAWRHGQCDVAVGCAGLAPLDDWRGRTDAAGRELRATWLAVADAAAATADLARAKDSHEPVVVLAGLERFVTVDDGPGAKALLRPTEEDLFR
jgi:coenzyme F420-0:L-glutamate ligase/coenzyme F420-1:gamma-L-glutamate ligase